MLRSFFKNKRTSSSLYQNQPISLSLETLEDRMMLSSVEIFAAGATGEENLDLLVNGEVAQTFFNVGGDASTRQFERFTFETDQTVTPGNIGIRFSNDAFDPSIGLDRDLIVDRIVVDGVNVEAENPSTFSTGVFRNGGVTGPGFLTTELLNINGTLTFSDPVNVTGNRVEFDALGTTGDEILQLSIDGQVVETFGFFAGPGVTQTFTFDSDDPNLSLGDIRIEFVNDFFDPFTGADRNVQISEFRVIDFGDGTGTSQVQRASTSDSNVLNSGIFVGGIGITEGLGAGGFLAGNGFVEIAGGESGIVNDIIEVDAFGTTGEELVLASVNGRTIGVFQLNNPGVTQTTSLSSFSPNISIEDVRLEFINDLFDPATGTDRNVQILEYRVIDGDTGQVTSARTTDSNVFNSGIYEEGVGITQGFGAGGLLAGEFNGSSFVEIRTPTLNPGNFQVLATSNDGPQGQSAFVTAVASADSTFSESSPIRARPVRLLLVVGDDGFLQSSFGDNGIVNLTALLGPSTGLVDPVFDIDELEFLPDGTLLLFGTASPGADIPVIGPLPPDLEIVQVGALLNADGTLNSTAEQA